MKIFGGSGNRWHAAQKKEQDHWTGNTSWQNHVERLELSEEQRHLLQMHLVQITRISVEDLKSRTLLEIGGRYFTDIAAETVPGVRAITLDPLANVFSKQSEKTSFIRGRAEEIPLKDNSVDICICWNTIDHVQSPWKALREIQRVLKPDGKLQITCNVYHEWARPLFPLFDLLDTPHPHHYSKRSFLNLLTGNDYRIDSSFSPYEINVRSLKGYLGKIFGLKHVACYCEIRA